MNLIMAITEIILLSMLIIVKNSIAVLVMVGIIIC